MVTAQTVDRGEAEGQREAVFLQSVARWITLDDLEEAPIRNALQVIAVEKRRDRPWEYPGFA